MSSFLVPFCYAHIRTSRNEWHQNSTLAAYFCLKICTLKIKKTSAFIWSVGFEHILKVMPHLSSEKVQRSYYVTQPRFPQVGLGISCPILIFIHDTLWAYPSVTQLKKLMLLTFSFYTSFGRRLTAQKVFREDLKELTEAEWRSETGSWFQITGAW